MKTAGLSFAILCRSVLLGGALLFLSGCGGEADSHSADAFQERADSQPATILFSGTVHHKETGDPIKEFRARLIACDPSGAVIPGGFDQEIDSGDGRFCFFPAAAGRYKLYVKSRDFVPRFLRNIEIPAETGLTGYAVPMVPGLHFEGRVVDDATNQPISGAIVGDLHAFRSTPAGDWTWIFDEDHRTDGEGRFFLGGLVRKAYTLVVVHPHHAEEILAVAPDGKELLFRLKKGARISGAAFDDSGAPAGGLKISFSSDTLPLERSVLTGSDGKYMSPPLGPGTISILAVEQPTPASGARRFTEETKEIVLTDTDTVVDFGPVTRHASWSGTFFDWKKEPVGGGTIAVQPIADEHRSGRPPVARVVRTDRAGRFEFKKLLPGRHTVILIFPGVPTITPIEWDNITFEESQSLERDIRITGGVVEGQVIDGFTGEAIATSMVRVMATPRSAGEAKRYMMPVGQDARFSLVNAPPGNYLFQAAVPRRPKGMVKDVEVAAGRVVDDLRIVIPVHGELRIKFTDMTVLAGKSYEIRADTDDADEAVPMGAHKVGKAEYWDIKINLKPGLWKVRVDFEGVDPVEREVEIKKLETSEVELFGKDFQNG